ncbi:phage portal protein [Listeria monocytogenes]|nr:phage portal protein [Listeria monocytogenes]EAE5902743.1 phage portal protein [Listeria monocytogenes]EHK9329981.1 phage portal protein [Listeria monocytogenes]EIQ6425906.1 phage portal protein [Listeria monocytogenes]EIQ6465907.1 phage portal protein [Listeria monocytogenes]
MLKSPFMEALGEREFQRFQKQVESYNYYAGYQHVDPSSGQLVKAKDLPRPPGLDYDPTRFEVNYFKRMIDAKAQWQMGGTHGISVLPQIIDEEATRLRGDYSPSIAQQKENKRAEGYEQLLYQLWRENNMRAALLSAAKDRLIASRVAVKIVFNPKTGKMQWVWHPDTEVFPVFSNDDYEELIKISFVRSVEIWDEEGEKVELIKKQTFELKGSENGAKSCYLTEGYYNENLEPVNEWVKDVSMGLPFIPAVLIPIQSLLQLNAGDSNELDDMREITDRLNQLNEDAIDSLKFEMFPVTYFKNIDRAQLLGIDIAPGAAAALNSTIDGRDPGVEKSESNFTYTTALNDTFTRLKGALHEVSSIPNFTAQDLNFGGMNAEALQIIFHDIIQDTEEHWHVWQAKLQELHEKSIRYLQARLSAPNFTYDKDVVKNIGEIYTNEIKFVLPLPDNRKDLVALLVEEVGAGFESTAGAMNRLGVENSTAKKQEIQAESLEKRQGDDIYALNKSSDTTLNKEELEYEG